MLQVNPGVTTIVGMNGSGKSNLVDIIGHTNLVNGPNELLKAAYRNRNFDKPMNIIYETSVKEAKPLPDFSGTDDSFVSLTLNGLVIDKQMLSVINRIGNERLDTLTTADFLTINALYHDMPLDSHMQERLKHLTELGIVEHIGRSKYVLSRSLYSAVGKSGVHTRIVGLDRETNKELLLKHMREKGEEGASFKEFQQVLPNLSRDQITVLLRGLRRENHAYCAGKTSASRWFAGPISAADIEE